MLHDLTPKGAQVWITYDLDFLPATAPAAASIRAVRPIWMDVENGKVYPVFDVLKGSGTNGTFTYPDQATDPYPNRAPANVWTVDRDGILVSTSGHLHPGGLHDDLVARSQRGDGPPVLVDRRLLRTGRRRVVGRRHDGDQPGLARRSAQGRRAPHLDDLRHEPGQLVRVHGHHGRLDGRRRSRATARPIRSRRPSTSPATPPTATSPRTTTTAARPTPSPTRRSGTAATAPQTAPIDITDYVFGSGDMAFTGPLPTVKAGGTLTFQNNDSAAGQRRVALDHGVQGAVQRVDGHRLADRRRRRHLRLGPTRRRRAAHGRPPRLADAGHAATGRLHLLLPHPPVHARRLRRHPLEEGWAGPASAPKRRSAKSAAPSSRWRRWRARPPITSAPRPPMIVIIFSTVLPGLRAYVQ